MAVYLNYGDDKYRFLLPKFGFSNVDSSTITNIDYTKYNLLLCHYKTNDSSSSNIAKPTVIGYDNVTELCYTTHSYGIYQSTYSHEYCALYTLTSDTITIYNSSVGGTFGWIFILKESVLPQSTTYLNSTSTLDTSSYDYTNNNYYIFSPLEFYLTATNTENIGVSSLKYIQPNTQSLTLTPDYFLNYFIISVPKVPWPELEVGDKIALIRSSTLPDYSLDLSGYKFNVKLHGASSYHEIDATLNFKSLTDGAGKIGFYYDGGEHLYVYNGTGTNKYYNRILVSGCYNITQNTGLIGGYGDTGITATEYISSSSDYYKLTAGGGYGAGPDHAGSGGSYTIGRYLTDNGSTYGNNGAFGIRGWYGGGTGAIARGYFISSSNSKSAYGGVGGGSSYQLTNDSYKPSGYLPEWETYVNLISDVSEPQYTRTELDDKEFITIVEVPSAQETYYIKYHNGTTFEDCEVYRYDGTNWVQVEVNYYDGTTWHEIKQGSGPTPITGNFIQFTSATGPFTVSKNSSSTAYNGTIEYSTDGTTWSTWDGSTLSGTTNDSIYLRGTNNTYCHYSNDPSGGGFFVLTGNDIQCNGNIENLLDYQSVINGVQPTFASDTFYGLFAQCTGLVSGPELPSMNLYQYCYAAMYYGCTNLAVLPELPATTLPDDCYSDMFYGCSNIKLSATQTGEYVNEYRIPITGTGAETGYTFGRYTMFLSTGGTLTAPVELNTTYYTSNTVGD